MRITGLYPINYLLQEEEEEEAAAAADYAVRPLVSATFCLVALIEC